MHKLSLLYGEYLDVAYKAIDKLETFLFKCLLYIFFVLRIRTVHREMFGKYPNATKFRW